VPLHRGHPRHIVDHFAHRLCCHSGPRHLERGAWQEAAALTRLRQQLTAADEHAIARMREVADRKDRCEKHIAMENRLSPMRELLGELLLEAGRQREAFREFEASRRRVSAIAGRRRPTTGIWSRSQATAAASARR